MKKLPVTRSAGGWRRKPRRITPFVIDNYWSLRRIRILRRLWPTYEPSWNVADKINACPAPRAVTLWQCKMMALHLEIRRPVDVALRRHGNLVARTPQELRETIQIANLRIDPIRFPDRYAVPEAAGLLRKVGRKPKTKLTVVRALPYTLGAGLAMKAPPGWRERMGKAIVQPKRKRRKKKKHAHVRKARTAHPPRVGLQRGYQRAPPDERC